ncbi:DUF2917 domain-containing protein [Ramlibacter sp. AN1015]|uniref:DUF2917 domain-containing protein n=1 Tax=Ramlibacter sp. AN1015 TaxID=3133428 RepID=UPI004040A99A
MPDHLLTARECRSLRVREGTRVTCTRGLLWLTFEPDARCACSTDRLASPGSTYVAPANGHLYLSPVHTHAEAAFELHAIDAGSSDWKRPLEALRRYLRPRQALSRHHG